MTTATTGQFYTAPEVAKLLGVTRKCAWEWAKKGRYEGQHAGRIALFPKDVIDREVEAREREAEAS